MINGEKQLRLIYPDLDENQYQPAGIDLTLGKCFYLKFNQGVQYGLLKDAKVLPEQKEMPSEEVVISGMKRKCYQIPPYDYVIAQTQEKIKIQSDSGQFYLPRSSLLRAGIDVRTAFGDPGFNGHLSFLLVNHSGRRFYLEEGVRFAQLVDMKVIAPGDEYDGDYNE